MSLKVEQRLDNNTFTEFEPLIYTTGAYLVPMQINFNGKKRYIWIVYEFDDDTYDENGEFCSPVVYSNSINNLILS